MLKCMVVDSVAAVSGRGGLGFCAAPRSLRSGDRGLPLAWQVVEDQGFLHEGEQFLALRGGDLAERRVVECSREAAIKVSSCHEGDSSAGRR